MCILNPLQLPPIQSTIYPVAHIGGTILAYRIAAAQTAIKRFFCAQNFSVLHYVGLGGTAVRLARAALVRQFHLVRLPMIGVVWCRVYNLIRAAIMNTISPRANTAQNPTTTPVFSIFLHRQAIAQGIDGSLAIRFKSRFPACIVKFAGFTHTAISEGGAL
jgi:hypothetical protein